MSASLCIVAAATLWGTTGTAETFAPSTATGVALGATTMGFGGLVLLALGGRAAFTLMWAGKQTWREVGAGAVAIAVYPLAFCSSIEMAGV
ncbi:MAG: hypothetical protein ACRDQF_05995, partial [Thermocrispum sp.]